MAHTPVYRTLLRALHAARREHLSGVRPGAPGAGAGARWSRRRFLGTAALAAPALALGDPSGPGGPQSARGYKVHRVAVVGGGLSGLNAAHRLLKAGVNVHLYEAAERLGGRILSRADAVGTGLVTEFGGEFINSAHTDMLDLAREFGLKVYNRAESPASSRYPNTAFFFGGARRDPAELARLLRPLAARIATDAALVNEDPHRHLAVFDRLSVTAYLDRHQDLIPQPWVRSLVETSIRTEFGSEPEHASALQLLYTLPRVDGDNVEVLGESNEAYCIQGGNSRIIAALGNILGSRVHTGQQLVSVRSVPGEPVRLGFSNGRSVSADQAIITLPFTILRSIKIDAALPERFRRAMAELGLGRNEKILAGFSRRAWQGPEGFVGEAWTDLGFAEVWDASQHQPERQDGALTFFLGAREVTVPVSSDGGTTQGRAFVERLETRLPGLRSAATDRYACTAWTANPLARGAYTNYQPGQITTFGDLRWSEPEDLSASREVRFDNLVFAGEHLSEAYFGYMNGAAQTGRLAAQSVLRYAAMTDGPYDP